MLDNDDLTKNALDYFSLKKYTTADDIEVHFYASYKACK